MKNPTKETLNFSCNTPCTSCPYRKDAKRKFWSMLEFIDLFRNENSQMGTIYACHKKNGSVCIGWLMMQDKNRLPSIMLRLKLLRDKITREYLDSLNCHSEMFDSTEEMIAANYPALRLVKE